jgi:hypothetical protein
MAPRRKSDRTQGLEEISKDEISVFSDLTPYPGFSPDVGRDVDDVIWALSGEPKFSEQRVTELAKRVVQWAGRVK